MDQMDYSTVAAVALVRCIALEELEKYLYWGQSWQVESDVLYITIIEATSFNDGRLIVSDKR
jgi:hypothetical protein